MKKYILAFAAVAAMLASCSQDDNLEAVENGTENNTPQPITTIYASSENGSRAVVDGSRILWQEGDRIGVLNSSMNIAYTLSNGEGTTSGEFSNAESGITSIDAVMYPYQQDATFDYYGLSFEIPTVQEGVRRSFDKNAAIMYGFGSSANQQLSLAVNFLKITIPVGVRSVTISSPTTSLTGKMKLSGGNVSAVTDKGCNYVRLIPANGAEYFISDDYYIAVKPDEIVTPTITFVRNYPLNNALQEISKTSTKNIQFSDNKNVVPLKVDFTKGDVTQRLALQLWEDGPYFATYNVGATDPSSDKGTFSWGGSYINSSDPEDPWTGSGSLSGNNDTATKLWGINWRMPTINELKGLIENCNSHANNGGVDVSSKSLNSNKLFFITDTNDIGSGSSCGQYWSSTPVDDVSNETAYLMIISSSENHFIRNSPRGNKCHVRAVLNLDVKRTGPQTPDWDTEGNGFGF